MRYEPATRLDDDLWLLDLNFQGTPGVIAAFLLTSPDGHTLIETGPGSTLGALQRAIAATGAQFEDITRILVTHIHLDHAGAAGTLLRLLPRATLYVHPLGAAHMINPDRLIKSATRIYGDQMQPLWGDFEPCPADRVVDVDDDTAIACGNRSLVALHTPGHAWHHIAWLDRERRSIFTGDVGGVRLQGSSVVHPPTPPPDIDLGEWRTSIARIRNTGAEQLYLTHFGRFADAGAHLRELESHLERWIGQVRERTAAGMSPQEMTDELTRDVERELMESTNDPWYVAAYGLANPPHMTVGGILRYLEQKR